MLHAVPGLQVKYEIFKVTKSCRLDETLQGPKESCTNKKYEEHFSRCFEFLNPGSFI
jgi:hypothetical protein